MSKEAQASPCFVRLCKQPATGVSPMSGIAVCQQHLQFDIEALKKRQEEVVQKLNDLSKESQRKALRLEQQALVAEMQEIADTFDAVQEMLQKWKDKLMLSVQWVHDLVAERLCDAAEAHDCSKEISLAADDGDLKRVMHLTASVQPWVTEASDRAAKFDESRVKILERQKQLSQTKETGAIGDKKDEDNPADDVLKSRSVGDVSGGLQQLQFLIDKHLTGVMQQCWLCDNETGIATGIIPATTVCRFEACIEKLPKTPRYLAVCSNTHGFVADSSGRVIPASDCAGDNESNQPLPMPCIFVSSVEKVANYLLVVSLDGKATRLQCHCNLNWKKRICGLHCDNNRQQMYICQHDAVTVADLAGQVQEMFTASSLGLAELKITDIDGNSDKVSLFDESGKRVLLIDKTSRQIVSSIDATRFNDAGLRKLSLLGCNKLLLLGSESGLIHKICHITGQKVAEYPGPLTGCQFKRPFQVASDGKGLLIVSDLLDHCVRILTSIDGALQQTLGTPGTKGIGIDALSSPMDVTISDAGGGRRQLLVSDRDNGRICVFSML